MANTMYQKPDGKFLPKLTKIVALTEKNGKSKELGEIEIDLAEFQENLVIRNLY